ncbi:MAG: hypothetical protein QXH91_04135 [Candidatus Bathyarchaeia archaeon]
MKRLRINRHALPVTRPVYTTILWFRKVCPSRAHWMYPRIGKDRLREELTTQLFSMLGLTEKDVEVALASDNFWKPLKGGYSLEVFRSKPKRTITTKKC